MPRRPAHVSVILFYVNCVTSKQRRSADSTRTCHMCVIAYPSLVLDPTASSLDSRATGWLPRCGAVQASCHRHVRLGWLVQSLRGVGGMRPNQCDPSLLLPQPPRFVAVPKRENARAVRDQRLEPTAKSRCPSSIWQQNGPGTKSISVIAKGAWYKINFSGLQLDREQARTNSDYSICTLSCL